MTEVIINVNTDGLNHDGFLILEDNVKKTDKLLIAKAKDSILKNKKTVTDITKPVNCGTELLSKVYYIHFSVSFRKDGKTPISYRINDSYENTVVSFEDDFSTIAEVEEVIKYVEDNLGKIVI